MAAGRTEPPASPRMQNPTLRLESGPPANSQESSVRARQGLTRAGHLVSGQAQVSGSTGEPQEAVPPNSLL